jgi:hypothetical protein
VPNFNVSSVKLHVRPVNETELPPHPRMGRGPSFEYLTYRRGPREAGARGAAAGGAAALFRMGAEAVNEYSLTPWLRNWLKNNESDIIAELDEKQHSVFIVQVNYAVAYTFETRAFLARDIYLLGTVPTLGNVNDILTADRLYGPKVDAIPPNNATRFQYAYLVGVRN